MRSVLRLGLDSCINNVLFSWFIRSIPYYRAECFCLRFFQEMEKQKEIMYFNADKVREEHQADMANRIAKVRDEKVQKRREMEAKRLRILQEMRVKEQDAREKALVYLENKERFMKHLQSEREKKRKLDREHQNVMMQLKEERVHRIAQAAEYLRQEMLQKTAENDRLIAERLRAKQEILEARSQALLQMNLER